MFDSCHNSRLFLGELVALGHFFLLPIDLLGRRELMIVMTIGWGDVFVFAVDQQIEHFPRDVP
jgi:hypothetical protein